MPASRSMAKSTERPTLPSIHALNLLSLSKHDNVQYDHHDIMVNWFHLMNFLAFNAHTFVQTRRASVAHNRRVSTSSSQTCSSSRNASPTPSMEDMSSPTTPTTPQKLRLAPCSLEEADAIICVYPRRKSTDFDDSFISPQQGKGCTATVLYTGASVEKFRRSYRGSEKGCAVHPFRVIDPRSIEARRASVISLNAMAFNSQ